MKSIFIIISLLLCWYVGAYYYDYYQQIKECTSPEFEGDRTISKLENRNGLLFLVCEYHTLKGE